MNIGLEVLNSGVRAVPSMEQMFDQYIACEKLVADTNRFSDYGDQLFTAFDNVMSLGKVAAKYNSNESLAVINSLVGAEFGGTFSAVEAQGALKSIWTKIKEFFSKIWSWIKTFFYRILNFFGGAKKRLQAMLKDYKNAKSGSKPWSYKGFDFAKGTETINDIREYITMVGNVKDFAAKVKAANNEAALSSNLGQRMEASNTADELIAQYVKKLNAKQTEHKVKSINEATQVIEGAIKAIDATEPIKKYVESCYTEWSKAVAEQEKKNPNDPKAVKWCKDGQKAMGNLIKGCNTINSCIMRSAASVMANGKFKADK